MKVGAGRWTASLALAGSLAACTGQVVGEETGGSQQWLCGVEDAAVVCTAAMSAGAEESGAYACMAGEASAACPPADALEGIPEIDALLAEHGYAGDLTAMPWACLLTGEHQRHCARDVGRATAALTADPGDEGDEFTPAPDDGSYEDPTPPRDCLPSSWEAYFCAHATYEYRRHGVDITFPCDIFDGAADFHDLALDSASVPTTPGAPSCHEGEWAMREGAWRDAVLAGCIDLDHEILVWCQQAANHAPSEGVCNATGTW